MNFDYILAENPLILIEGPIIERVKREFSFKLDKHIENALMIYDDNGKKLLNRIYREYIDIAKESDLPIINLTPTWRANPDRIELAGLKDKNINLDAFDFLSNIREEYIEFSKKILIGGLIGCKGDAYNPKEALSSDEAYHFHKFQIETLANAGVDLLFASTLPALSEALGIAISIANLTISIPYILSFVIRPNGTLLDGTPLHQAISIIDYQVSRKPYYMINCVHPTTFRKAMNNLDLPKQHLIGLQANGSMKTPEELDNIDEIDSEEPNTWAKLMLSSSIDFNLKILGGCCGTNNQHLQSLVNNFKTNKLAGQSFTALT